VPYHSSITLLLNSADSIRVKMGMAKRMDTALYEVLWPVSCANILVPGFMGTWILIEFKQPTLPMIVVNFVLLKTLSDPEPIVVRRELQSMSFMLVIVSHSQTRDA
jgi:hypothetical protein